MTSQYDNNYLVKKVSLDTYLQEEAENLDKTVKQECKSEEKSKSRSKLQKLEKNESVTYKTEGSLVIREATQLIDDS